MAEQQGAGNRRHQLVVKRRFQYNYVLTALVTILLIVNVCIITAMLWLGDARQLGITAVEGALIGLVELLMVGLVGYLGLKKSHTIAGPVMVMERNLGRVRDGDLTVRMRLRKSDSFQHSADAFNEMADSLCNRIGTIKAVFSRLDSHARSNPDIAPALDEMRAELGFFRTSPEENQSGARDESD